MAIRFACPSCGQPIEIDDEWAGQSVACPYCRRVVNAPRESSWPPGNVPVAAPAAASTAGHQPTFGGITPPLPPGGAATHRTYSSEFPRPQGAGLSSAGWALLLALFCGALSLCGWVLWMGPLVKAVTDKTGPTATPEEVTKVLQEMLINQQVPSNPSAGWAAGLGIVCGLAALALAARSMIRQEGRTVMAIAACLLAALFVVCEALLAVTMLGQHAGVS